MADDICLIGKDKIKASSLQVLTAIILLKIARTGAIAPGGPFLFFIF
jgi:hypothetical protein